MAAAAAAGGAALCGPRSNPSGDGPRLQSPPGKGKPVALADITNTGRRNATKSLSVADVVKENAKLIQLLKEKTKIIDVTRVEMQKLHLALQASRQQNQQLAQTNSQILAELNLGKDRLKALQHELSCTAALIKVKDSEFEKRSKAANQRRKDVNSQDVTKAIPFKVPAVNSHRIDGSATITAEHHLVDSRSVVPSTTACQEPPNDTTKRGTNKRKSESSECMKETNVMQDHDRPHLQPVLSLDYEDPRKTVRRRSTRLNRGSSEVTEVSFLKLPEDDVVPSAAPSNLNVQKQHKPTTEEDMRKSQQNELSHEVVAASGLEKIEINEQPRKEANSKEAQEACCSVPEIEAKIGGKVSTTKRRHLIETQSSLPVNVAEPPKALEDTGDERKSQRRKSSRLHSVLSENTMSTSETLHEDVIAPLPPSSLTASMEQTINQKQTDGCSSTKGTEGQVAGRRSLRRAAEKVVSYKEIPLNVKMRRP